MNQDLRVADERIGDDEREHVVRELTRHCGDGRLTLDELEERSTAAYAALTRAELDHLLRDLPPGPPAPAAARSGEDRQVDDVTIAPRTDVPHEPPPPATPVRTTRQLDGLADDNEKVVKAICVLLVIAGFTLLFNGSLILAILCWVASGSLKNRFL